MENLVNADFGRVVAARRAVHVPSYTLESRVPQRRQAALREADQEARAAREKMASLRQSRDPTRKALRGPRALRAARVRIGERGQNHRKSLLLSAS